MRSRLLLICVLVLTYLAGPALAQPSLAAAASILFDEVGSALRRTKVVATALNAVPIYSAPPSRFGGSSKKIGTAKRNDTFAVADTSIVASLFGNQNWIRITPNGNSGSTERKCANTDCWVYVGRSKSGTQNFKFETAR